MKGVTRLLVETLQSSVGCPLYLRLAPAGQGLPYAVLTPLIMQEFDAGVSEGGATQTTWEMSVFAEDDFAADELLERISTVLNESLRGQTLGDAEIIYSAVTEISDDSDLSNPDGDEQVIQRVIQFTLQYN